MWFWFHGAPWPAKAPRSASVTLEPRSLVPYRARLFRTGVVLLCAAQLGACALSFDARSLGAPATMAAPASAPPVGNEFHLSEKAVFLFFGAVTASEPSLQRSLAGQLAGGASVANLRVGVSSRFSDILISILSVGMIVPRTVTFDGVIVGGH